MKRIIQRVILAVVALAFAGGALAQAWPNRPVRVVVPWPPGQATDIAARLVAQKLQESLGQPFVIDNRPGAGGMIGTAEVVKAANDGYTLLAASSGPISINPVVQKTSYDPLRDLQPVSLIAFAPFALVTNPGFPAPSARDLISLVRGQPNRHSFSSSGTGATAHLITEWFNTLAGLQAIHVPYKGSAPALTDVMNGNIAYTFETVASVASHVRGGKLRALAVSSARRSSGMPEVPTVIEATGIAGFDIGAWIGYAGPAGMPREIAQRLAVEIARALAAPDLRERYLALGLEAMHNTPDEMAAFMRREQDRYAEIAKRANIRID